MAAAPFAVLAQAGSAAPKKDAKAPAASGEITLVIEGSIQGGRFFFKEKTIQFDTLNKYDWPNKDVIVNGKPWRDLSKPFKLDYEPDFGKAVILEKQGGPDGNTYVLPREKMFALMIVPREKDAREAPFRIKLAVKNQVPHNDLPPDETPRTGGTSSRAGVITTRREQQKAASGAAEERFTLVLEGEIKGRGKFHFHVNRIEYRPESKDEPDYPENVTVNGKPWEDLKTPYELDFVTDYTTGRLADRSGSAATGWRGLPLESSLFDRFEGSVGELSVISDEQEDDASDFRAAISFRKYPQDYVARILAMLANGREKTRKGDLESVYLSDQDELSPSDIEKVEKWREERRQEQLVWSQDRDYTTDGKELPYLTRTGTPGLREPFPDQLDVTIEAVLDYSAEFAFLGNKILYNDQSYPNEGKYPSQVKINGMPWKNLHQPFTLDGEIDSDSVDGMSVETEYYRYYLRPERNRIALGIVNHGPRGEEPVRIKLSLRKKAGQTK